MTDITSRKTLRIGLIRAGRMGASHAGTLAIAPACIESVESGVPVRSASPAGSWS